MPTEGFVEENAASRSLVEPQVFPPEPVATPLPARMEEIRQLYNADLVLPLPEHDYSEVDPYGFHKGEPGFVYTAEPQGGPPNPDEEIRKLS